jgi:outer membrane biosynthesis protein TonB
VIERVCADESGAVTTATVVRMASPKLDRWALVTVRRWRYRPYFVNGGARAFCTVAALPTEAPVR